MMSHVLSVGQCGFDSPAIARVVRRALGADVIRAHTFPEAMAALRSTPVDLVLVNRVTDADGTSGLDLIRQIVGDPAFAGVPVMLVSDYAEAQQNAVATGAAPGFGKSDFRSGLAEERLKAALESPKPATS